MMEETPTVELLPDGTVKCAKGLDLSECGYKPGAKVCGKCGATATSVKGGGYAGMGEWVEVPGKKKPYKAGATMGGMGMAVPPTPRKPSPEMMEEEEDDMPMPAAAPAPAGMGGPAPAPAPAPAMPAAPAAAPAPMEEEAPVEEEPMPEDEEEKMWGIMADLVKKRKKARKARMKSMGVKSAAMADDDKAFVCAIERKVYAGGASICANCPGGCAPHEDMPSLLEIEGIAEDMFSGKILDSGYADQTDIFVVDVQRKDGKPIEAYFDGTTGECMGWHLLNENLIGEVAAVPGEKIISFDEAAAIAVKSIEGEVMSVDADLFEGYDAYAVEIEGVDGKSYDVFVGVDGNLLGYDEYEPEEAFEIEEEVADLALKRMYSEDKRKEMAKGGMALPDGSYPIADEADLRNAIQAFGRAKNKPAAKKHIMKRAKALGMMKLIPQNWMSGNDMEDGKSLSDDETKDLLGSLLEFEMLTIEHGIDGEDKK